MAVHADTAKVPGKVAFEVGYFLATFLPSDPAMRRAVLAAAMDRDIRMGYIEAPPKV